MTFQNVRLKITSPALKLKVAPRLSASVGGANGLAVNFINGMWVVGTLFAGDTLATEAWVLANAPGAPLNSPNFTGTPKAPTAAPGDNSLTIANTAFVVAALAVATVTSVTFNDVALTGAVVIPPVVDKFRAETYPGMTFNVFGDSISTGTGASTPAKFGWAPLLANRLSLTLSNHSLTGMGSNYGTKQAFANQAAWNRRSEVSAWMIYHNDVYRGGGAANTLTKIQGELRAFLANSFLNSAVPINDASITKTGTWTAGSAINEKAVNLNAGAGRLMYSSTLNDTLTWTFTGDNLVVGLFNTSGAVGFRYGTCTIAVDGATSGNGFATFSGDGLSDGISDGVYDNKITHNAVVLSNLGTGSHTVVLKVTGNVGPVYVDYFGTLSPQINSAPVLIAEAPRPDATGYATLGGGIWSPAAFNAADAAVRSVVREFYNYPITLVKTNNWLNNTTDVSADHEHPNDIGHSHIAAAFQEGIKVRAPTFLPGTNLTMTADQSITNAAYNAISFGVNNFDDDGLHSTSVNPTRITFKAAGYSRFEGHIGFASNATGIREAYIFKNGAQLRMIATSPALSGDNTVCPFNTIIQHNAGDYFELNAIQSSGGALNVVAAQTMLTVTPIR